MTSNSIRVGGIVTFWSTGEWTSRNGILAGFRVLSLDKFVPEEPSDFSCLGAALREVFPKGYLVRPLRTRTGYDVSLERRGDERNDYSFHCTYKAKDATVTASGNDHELEAVRSTFTQVKTRLSGDAVGVALTGVLGMLGGTRLRPRGGVYWLADTEADAWASACAVVENAAIRGENKVYQIRHEIDAQSVRAVRDAITAEVTSEVARLEQEILEGGLGGRALRTREELCCSLRDKVKVYEGLLSTGLTSLLESLDRAELAASQAAMLAAASETVGVG